MYRFIKTILALAVFIGLSATLPAQWINVPNNDTVVRPVNPNPFVWSSAIPTTSTITSLDIVLNGYSIAGGNATGTIPAGTVGATEGARTLAGRIVDNDAGGEIRGTITLVFTTQFGRRVTEVVTISSATGLYFSTKYACVGKPAITLALTGTEASDTLNIAPYKAGFGVNATTLANVLFCDVSSSSVIAADAGTWSYKYGTYLPAATVAEGDTMFITGFSDRYTDPGAENPTAITGATNIN